MADVLNVPYPRSVIQPDEPNLLAGWDFADNDLAVWGRYPNKAALGGAAYDLTRTGDVLVAQGGGIHRVWNGADGYYGCPVVPVGNSQFAYTAHLQAITATHVGIACVWNGAAASGHYFNLWSPVGTCDVGFSTNFGGVTSTSGYSMFNRGPFVVDGLYDGVQQHLVINGRLTDSDNVAPGVPAGGFRVGRDGIIRLAKVYNVRRTVAQARASYVREFARRVKFSWIPAECGEGPAAGVLTNSTPGGYATCPSGGASLQFVWVNDLSVPGGGYLTLTDSGALSMRRIDLALSHQPMFGSWLIRYKLRNPVFGGDNPRVGLIGSPGADMTAAGSRSIWVESLNNGGGWWRTQVQRENAGLIGVDADIDVSVMGPGDDCATLLTHGVDGNLRVYAFSRMRNSWAWRAAAVVNDVNFLDYNWISIAPRGSYIKSVHAYQGELDPHELAAKVL